MKLRTVYKSPSIITETKQTPGNCDGLDIDLVLGGGGGLNKYTSLQNFDDGNFLVEAQNLLGCTVVFLIECQHSSP
jgi:hypothetical protein